MVGLIRSLYPEIAFLVLWLSLCYSLGLGVDEAHYALYARNPDLSYFDHPPLVGWVLWFTFSIFGENVFSARLPALFCTLWTLLELKKKWANPCPDDLINFSPSIHSHKEAVEFLFIPVPLAMSLFFLPDTLLLPMVIRLMRLISQPTISNHQSREIGFWLGLSGLTKYTSVLLIPFVLWSLWINQRDGKTLLKTCLQIGSIAFFLILPVMIWNLQNDWISFRYQIHHIQGGHVKSPYPFAISVVMQWIGYGLITAPLIVKLSIKKIIDRMDQPPREQTRSIIPMVTGLGILSFFLWSSRNGVILLHWTLIAWWLLFGENVKDLTTSQAWKIQRVMNGMLWVGILTFLWLPRDWKHQINLSEVLGWPELMQEVSKNVSKEEAIILADWTKAGRAIFYSPQDLKDRILVWDQRFDQFDLWQKNVIKPKRGVVMIWEKEQIPSYLHHQLNCDKNPIKLQVQNTKKRNWKHDVSLYRCEILDHQSLNTHQSIPHNVSFSPVGVKRNPQTNLSSKGL